MAHGPQCGLGAAGPHRIELVKSGHYSCHLRRGPQNKGSVQWCFKFSRWGKYSIASPLINSTGCHWLGWCLKPTLSSSTRRVPYLLSQLGPFKHQSFNQIISSSLGGFEAESLRTWDSSWMGLESRCWVCWNLAIFTTLPFTVLITSTFQQCCQEFLKKKNNQKKPTTIGISLLIQYG